MEFKVGDKVKWVSSKANSLYTHGRVYELVAIREDGRFEVTNNDGLIDTTNWGVEGLRESFERVTCAVPALTNAEASGLEFLRHKCSGDVENMIKLRSEGFSSSAAIVMKCDWDIPMIAPLASMPLLKFTQSLIVGYEVRDDTELDLIRQVNYKSIRELEKLYSMLGNREGWQGSKLTSEKELLVDVIEMLQETLRAKKEE